MRTVLSIAFMLATLCQQSIAQNPRSEFTLTLSENQVELKPGEVKTIEAKILRSKGYHKSKAAMSLSSALPAGISLTYEPSSGLIQSSAVTIVISDDVKPGTYLLLPQCTLNNKSKGTTLKVVVTGNTSEVSQRE